MGSFMTANKCAITTKFEVCDEPGCMITSATADFPSMTIRTGLSCCIDHVKWSEVTTRISEASRTADLTLVFYDVELSRDGEIEQIGARALTGESFSAIVRTSVRANTSPILRSIPPEMWNVIAAEPASVIEDFNNWLWNLHTMRTNGNKDSNKIILAAHNGSCHDHPRLLRMMMKWGTDPPNYRLSDTLAIFKVIKGTRQVAKLQHLVNTYAAWLDHVPHDANSDADALRTVTSMAFPNTVAYCHAFGIDCKDFMARSGLNMYVASTVFRFSYVVDVQNTDRRLSDDQSESTLVTRSSA